MVVFKRSTSTPHMTIMWGGASSSNDDVLASVQSRPFGVALLVGGVDNGKNYVLYHADPSGTYVRYEAKAIGSGSEGAQSLLQEKYSKDLSLQDALTLAVTVLKQVSAACIDAWNLHISKVHDICVHLTSTDVPADYKCTHAEACMSCSSSEGNPEHSGHSRNIARLQATACCDDAALRPTLCTGFTLYHKKMIMPHEGEPWYQKRNRCGAGDGGEGNRCERGHCNHCTQVPSVHESRGCRSARPSLALRSRMMNR
jgi:hypothetical protein